MPNLELKKELQRNIAEHKELKWCPGWESNPHEEKSPEDFKSSASAIPPPGQGRYKSSEYSYLLQYGGLHRRRPKHSGVGSGVGWSRSRGIQPLHGGQRVLWSEVRVSHSHGNCLMTEKLLQGAWRSATRETGLAHRLKFRSFVLEVVPLGFPHLKD
jgi:hypothetical protein